MEDLSFLKAIQIKREINTEGSAPLFVTGEDDLNYYAKPIRTAPPCLEIINEFLCSNLLSYWALNTPEIRLMNIDYELAQGKNLSKRYKPEYFSKPFFASRSIDDGIELEKYFMSFNKNDLTKFVSPKDIIKIGYFDLWIGNKDRKPKNPNILLSLLDDKFIIHPIDHGAGFCYLQYLQVTDINLWLSPDNSILTTQMAKVVAKELFKDGAKEFWENDILCHLKHIEENIDLIFSKVPRELGFSKKAKEHLKEFLFDDKRNCDLWRRAIGLLG
jgi:hypothetical protein